MYTINPPSLLDIYTIHRSSGENAGKFSWSNDIILYFATGMHRK